MAELILARRISDDWHSVPVTTPINRQDLALAMDVIEALFTTYGVTQTAVFKMPLTSKVSPACRDPPFAVPPAWAARAGDHP